MTEEDELVELETLETADTFGLQEVDELQELTDEVSLIVFDSDSADLNISVKLFISNFKESKIPCALFNHHLEILWHNSAFSRLFNNMDSFLGKSLPSLFQNSEDPEIFIKLKKDLNTPDTGYSFQGRMEFSSKKSLTILTETTVNPIFEENSRTPLYFFIEFQDFTNTYRNLLKNTYAGLLEASILKDNDTGKHVERVGAYAKRIAQELYDLEDYPEVDIEFIDNILNLARMHDVGKIGTPDDILNKEGPLEDWEWDIMKEHTINGAYLLGNYPNPMAKDIALFHHENWNGTGYPYQVSENMIPLSARITSIADVYDALRMERSYKKGIDHDSTIAMISQQAGTKFDPALISIILHIQRDLEKIWDELKD